MATVRADWAHSRTDQSPGQSVHPDVTKTSAEQRATEQEVAQAMAMCEQADADWRSTVPLERADHVQYCERGLGVKMGRGLSSLDASRPWLCYWTCHSLELLGRPVGDGPLSARTVDFLARCQDAGGGFCGGPTGHMPHLAPTFAAISALVTVGTGAAYAVIDRAGLLAFLRRLKQPDGSFALHVGGETDVRGTYCAAAVAVATGVASEELFAGTAEWIASCQTFEGGLGGEPGNEAHGGYTYCGLAALALLQRLDAVDAEGCARWLAGRQYEREGGFAGRTNKLVDCCYGFWQSAVPSLLHAALAATSGSGGGGGGAGGGAAVPGYDRLRLQEYLLCCCQSAGGGLRDKPSKRADFYHTAYGLAGLSVAQHGWSVADERIVLGPPDNLLPPVDACYNVSVHKASQAAAYFSALPRV